MCVLFPYLEWSVSPCCAEKNHNHSVNYVPICCISEYGKNGVVAWPTYSLASHILRAKKGGRVW